MPLNPLGRGISETKDKRGRLLSCKQTLKIAVMNVRTIRQKDKRNELAELTIYHNTNILGIIDHKICHEEDKFKYEKFGKLTLITT